MQSRDKLFGGAWYIYPSDQDKNNVVASRVKRMVVGWELATSHAQPGKQHPLEWLRDHGISVLMRIPKDVFFHTSTSELFAGIDSGRSHCDVEAVIAPNEPDSGYDMSYASQTTWGNEPDPAHGYPQGFVWYYKAQMDWFIAAYNQHYPPVLDIHRRRVGRNGPDLVAGALANRTIGPSSQPWPGAMAWNRNLYMTLSQCDKWAEHIYTENGHGGVDDERLQYGAQVACSMGNPPYILDEIGVLHKDPESNQVGAYINFCRFLHDPERGGLPGGLGSLVDLVVPFTFNGDPQGGKAWPPSYLLSDPASYAAIGTFIQTG